MRLDRSLKIGDVVFCHCPAGLGELPLGLPENARAKIVATYIGATFVEYDGRTFIVPDACIHSGSELEAPKTKAPDPGAGD